MEQRKLFQGYSPPNIGSYAPLKISVNFCFRLIPTTDYIGSSWNLIYSYTMKLSRAYYFEVTVHHILAELCPFENSVIFSFLANSYSLHPIELKLCKYYIIYIYIGILRNSFQGFWGQGNKTVHFRGKREQNSEKDGNRGTVLGTI